MQSSVTYCTPDLHSACAACAEASTVDELCFAIVGRAAIEEQSCAQLCATLDAEFTSPVGDCDLIFRGCASARVCGCVHLQGQCVDSACYAALAWSLCWLVHLGRHAASDWILLDPFALTSTLGVLPVVWHHAIAVWVLVDTFTAVALALGPPRQGPVTDRCITCLYERCNMPASGCRPGD